MSSSLPREVHVAVVVVCVPVDQRACVIGNSDWYNCSRACWAWGRDHPRRGCSQLLMYGPRPTPLAVSYVGVSDPPCKAGTPLIFCHQCHASASLRRPTGSRSTLCQFRDRTAPLGSTTECCPLSTVSSIVRFFRPSGRRHTGLGDKSDDMPYRQHPPRPQRQPRSERQRQDGLRRPAPSLRPTDISSNVAFAHDSS